jgi:hypothetical protein
MAAFTLVNPERYGDKLPPVCLCCGEKATLFKRKRFTWHPSWVYLFLPLGLLPVLIVAMIVTKSATIEAPLCTRHRYHWSGRTALVLLSLFGIIFLVFVAIALSSTSPRPTSFGQFLWGMVLFGFLGWLVTVVIVSSTTIRASKITADSLTLRNVADNFETAVREFGDPLARDIEAEIGGYWEDKPRRPKRTDPRISRLTEDDAHIRGIPDEDPEPP